MEVGAPTGRWQLIVVYRGKHDPLCVTYLAALQHLMPEFEEIGCDVVTVSADTRGKACSFVSAAAGADRRLRLLLQRLHSLPNSGLRAYPSTASPSWEPPRAAPRGSSAARACGRLPV